jgi:hypothetical protein
MRDLRRPGIADSEAIQLLLQSANGDTSILRHLVPDPSEVSGQGMTKLRDPLIVHIWDLVRSAATGEPASPVSPEEMTLMERERALYAGTPADGFMELVVLCPPLGHLEHEIVTNLSVGRTNFGFKGSNGLKQRIKTLRLLDKVNQVLGPSALEDADPLIRTQVAAEVAREYLRTLFKT